ncbi:hypothetical protein ACVFYP_09170 [Roseomonas sp. F4]
MTGSASIPARPIRLAQLLFLPLEGVMQAAAGLPHVPRVAIPAITALVVHRLPALVAEVEATAPWHGLTDHAVVAALGARLWPAAGQALRDGAPPGWSAPGLPEAAVAPVLATVSAILRRAVPLWQVVMASDPPEDLLHAALAPLAAEGPAPLAAGLALLMPHAARPGLVATLTAGLAPELEATAEAALAERLAAEARMLEEAEGPGALATAAFRLGNLLEEAELSAAWGVAEARQVMAAALRRQAAQACHGHYAAALAARLLAPVTRAAAAPPASDAVVAGLEATARELTALERAGRRLGQEADFDRRREEALRRLLRLAATPAGLTGIELARLAEILAGPQAALALLEAA